MIELIFKYEKTDPEYFQLLMTISDLLPTDELPEFEALLNSAIKKGQKIKIKENELLDFWDNLEVKNLELRN